MKKRIALILAAAMLLSMLAACGNTAAPEQTTAAPAATEAGDTEVHLWDGRYVLDIEGMLSWVHFNEDGTYYGLYFGGSATEAGVWELAEEELEYRVAFEDENTFATASQVVIMTSYTTGNPVKVAYAEDALRDMSLKGMANHRTLIHEADYEYNADRDETPLLLYVFFANNEIGSTFNLYHNGSFEDVTGDAFLEGTWKMTGAGTYDLVYDGGVTGTLTVAGDGKTAQIVRSDGTSVDVRDDYNEPSNAIAQLMSLRQDDAQVGLPMGVGLRIDGYSDGTCQLIVEVAAVGAELVADQGTYEVSPAMKPTFHFEVAGDIEGTPDYATASEAGISFTVAYRAETSVEFNGTSTPLTVDAELVGIYNPNAVAAEPQVINTMCADEAAVEGLPMSVGLRVDCYDDGTAVLVMEIAALGAELEVDHGTYEVSETMKYTFNFETAGEVIGNPDYATATAEGLDIHVGYKADLDVIYGDTTMPVSIDVELVGFHHA